MNSLFGILAKHIETPAVRDVSAASARADSKGISNTNHTTRVIVRRRHDDKVILKVGETGLHFYNQTHSDLINIFDVQKTTL